MYKKSKVLLIAASIFSITVGINATETRSAGMEITQANGNTWAAEGQLPYIFVNPAALGNFAPMMFGEYNATTGGGKGGIITSMGKSLNLGVFSGQEIDTVSLANTTTSVNTLGTPGSGMLATLGWVPGTALPALTKNNAIVIANFMMGNNMGLGFGVSFARASTSNKNSATSISSSAAITVIHPTLGLMMGMGKMSLDVSAGLIMNNIKLEDSNAAANTSYTLSNGGIGDIVTDVVLAMPMGKGTIRFNAGLDLLDSSAKATFASGTNSGDETLKKTGTRIKAGVSSEMNVSQNILAFFGLGFQMESVKTPAGTTWTTTIGGVTTSNPAITGSTTVSSMFLPLFLGAEAELSERWAGRFGVKANLLDINGNKTEGAGATISTSNWNNPNSSFTAGVSLNAGSFSFDWNINLPLFTNGPIKTLESSFAATYKFGK